MRKASGRNLRSGIFGGVWEMMWNYVSFSALARMTVEQALISTVGFPAAIDKSLHPCRSRRIDCERVGS